MIRDFSDAAKANLIHQIKEVTPNGIFGKVADFFGDIWLGFQEKYGSLNIQSYVNDVDTYHKMILDRNDTEIQQIEEIFQRVHEVDEGAGGAVRPLADVFEQERSKIKRLEETLTIPTFRFTPDTIQAIQSGQKNPEDFKSKFKYDWKSCGKRDVTDEFLNKVEEICEELGISPDDLMSVMAFESGLDHTISNRYSGATGLIQFMPFTAEGLGTTTEQLKNMSAVEQLDYVKRYLKGKGVGPGANSLSDLYMSVLWPAAVGKDDSYVLFRSGTTTYSQNAGLDTNHDGVVTKAEAVQMVLNARKRFVGE